MNEDNKKRSRFNKLLLLIALLLIPVIYYLYPLIHNYGVVNTVTKFNCDTPYPVALCKKGDIEEYIIKNSNQVAKFICLDEMNKVSGLNMSIKLKNGKILIYNEKCAELYNPETKTFTLIKGEIPERNPLLYNLELPSNNELEYIVLPNNKYLLFIGTIYNENNNRLEQFTDKQFEKYVQFIKSRKESIKEIRYIKTLNNTFQIYTGKEDKEWIVWTEDPVNLERSEYGSTHSRPIGAEMKNKEKIYLISKNNIELFNSKTGYISSLINDKNIYLSNITSLIGNKLLILEDQNNSYSFDLKAKTIKEVDKEIKKTDSLLELARSFRYRKELWPGNYTVINDNEVLITGSYIKNGMCPFEDYKSAELMSIEDKP